MPSLASLHPQIVHFAIALLAVGVALRWVSLTGKLSYTGPAAVTLLLLGTVAAVLAVSSGTAAHGPVERIPGAAAAVRDHEEWGERTRNIFLAIAALEVLGVILTRRPAVRRGAHWASAVVGLLGGYALVEVGGKGGELVYSFAGGPGLRTGDTADIGRLYTAGLYEQAMVDRARRQPVAAAALIDELAHRSPGDTTIELLRIESLLVDRHDAPGALAALSSLHVSSDNPRLRVRAGMLAADAYEAAGQRDSARAVLQRLVAEFPTFRRLKERLERLGG